MFRAPDLYSDEEKEAAFEGKQVDMDMPESSLTSSADPKLQDFADETLPPAPQEQAAPRRLSRDSASKLPDGMVLTVSGLARSSNSITKNKV